MMFNAKIEEFEEGTGFILPQEVIDTYNLKAGDTLRLTIDGLRSTITAEIINTD